MRRLIDADLKRILIRPKFWIFNIIALVVGILIMGKGIINTYDDDISYQLLLQIKQAYRIATILQSFVIFSSVYSDEFRSMAFITVVGRGISRRKLVFAKLLDSIILTLLISAITGGIMLAFGGIMSRVATDPEEIGMISFLFLNDFVYEIIAITIPAVFIYITEKIPVSVFVLIVLHITSVLLGAYTFDWVKELAIQFYFTEVLSNAWTHFVLGNYPMAFFDCLGCLLCYIGGCIGIIRLTFEKKELSF